jgi:hypothetical protein
MARRREGTRVHVASLRLGPMPRLGSLLLSGVLLGVPRALQSRTFGAPQRTVYVEVSRPAPALGAFAEAFTEALADATWGLARTRSAATTVVELVSVVSTTDRHGRAVEAFTLSVREGGRSRRIVLHGRPDDRLASARQLIATLARSAS